MKHQSIVGAFICTLLPVLSTGCTRSHETSKPEGAANGNVAAPSRTQQPQKGETGVSQLIGRPAPTLSLKKLGGGRVELSSMRGQVVLLSFWMDSCPPCHVEAPHLQRLHQKYSGQGLRLIGVTPLLPLAGIQDFVQRYGLTYSITVDPGEKVIRKYGFATYPAAVLIDRRGLVRFVHNGFSVGDEKKLEEELRSLL